MNCLEKIQFRISKNDWQINDFFNSHKIHFWRSKGYQNQGAYSSIIIEIDPKHHSLINSSKNTGVISLGKWT